MKKKYIAPAMEVITDSCSEILAGSINAGSNPISPNPITDPNDIGAKQGSMSLWDDVDDNNDW